MTKVTGLMYNKEGKDEVIQRHSRDGGERGSRTAPALANYFVKSNVAITDVHQWPFLKLHPD